MVSFGWSLGVSDHSAPVLVDHMSTGETSWGRTQHLEALSLFVHIWFPRVIGNNFGRVSRFCPWHLFTEEACLPVIY